MHRQSHHEQTADEGGGVLSTYGEFGTKAMRVSRQPAAGRQRQYRQELISYPIWRVV